MLLAERLVVRCVAVDDGGEPVTEVPLEFPALARRDFCAMYQISFCVVDIVEGSVRQQPIQRAGGITIAMFVRRRAVAVGIVGVRLIGVAHCRMVCRDQLIAVVVTVSRRSV